MVAPKSVKKPFPIAKAVVPLITLGILIVLWRLNAKWWTIPVIVFVLFYYLIVPKVARNGVAKFNRKALLLLTKGQAKAVPRLAKRNIILQLIAPRGSLDGKLALAYAELDQYSAALDCFESAIPVAPPTEQAALQTGLAKALLVTGDLARAEAEGLAVLYHITRLPELLTVVARAKVGQGKLDDETRSLLDEAEKLSPSPDVALMITLTRIEMALQGGRKPPALPEQADSKSRLVRAWIHMVRGLMREHRGDTDKAAKSFVSAIGAMPDDTFISHICEEKLSTMRADTDVKSDDPEEQKGRARDPAIRRKRKRRR